MKILLHKFVVHLQNMIATLIILIKLQYGYKTQPSNTTTNTVLTARLRCMSLYETQASAVTCREKASVLELYCQTLYIRGVWFKLDLTIGCTLW